MQMTTFPFDIKGVPCIIKVITYLVVPPNKKADNDHDFNGFTEFEFEVLDRRGNRAVWLDRKVDNLESKRIESAYCEIVRQEQQQREQK
jgi:hypothetical protein